MDEPPPANLFQVDAAVGQALAERLAILRRTRDASAAARALEAVDPAARGRENLLPHILSAVRAQGTPGEICDTPRRGVRGPPTPGGFLRRGGRALDARAGVPLPR